MHSLKTRFIPTAVVLAVLGVGAWVFAPYFGKTDNGNGEDRSVLLTVDFTPVKRNEAKGVIIARTVAGTALPTFSWHESPWVDTVYVKKGDRISLTPTQFVNGYLRCSIRVAKGNFVENERTTLGNLKCRLTVT